MKALLYLWFVVLITFFSCSGAVNNDSISNKSPEKVTIEIVNKIDSLEKRVKRLEDDVSLLKKTTKSKNNNKKTIYENNRGFSFGFYLLLILVILFFINKKYSFLKFSRSVSKEKHSSRIRKNKEPKNDEFENVEEKDKEKKVDNNNNKPTTNEANKNVNSKNERNIKQPEEDNPSPVITFDITDTAKEEPEYFYLPTPEKEGFFDRDFALPYNKEKESLFECKYTNNEKTIASFQLIDDEFVKRRSIQGFDYILLPVCDDKGTFRPNLRIKFFEPGIIELQGDKWQVVKKAIIKFE